MAYTDWEAFGSAVYSALGSATGAGTVAIYQGLAPSGTQPPYIVFERIEGIDEYKFNSDGGVNTEYMVKAISHDEWPDEAQATYAIYHAVFQDARLTITGYTTLFCRRVRPIGYRDTDNYQHRGGIYAVEAWRT